MSIGQLVQSDERNSNLAPKPFTVGSLFSGIGGIDLAFVQTGGFDIRWQVEIDPFCRKVLMHHSATCWPHARIYKDVHNVGRHNLESVDIICGGFPCQPISSAGSRKVYEDERYLWPEFARIIGELRPRIVFLENVDDIVAPVKRDGIVIAPAPALDVLNSLSALGYCAEWGIVPAAAVGAPHSRNRWWLVAYADPQRRLQQNTQATGYDGQSDAALRQRSGRTEFCQAVTSGQGVAHSASAGLSQSRQSAVAEMEAQGGAGMVVQPQRQGSTAVGVAQGNADGFGIQEQRPVWEQGTSTRSGSWQSQGTGNNGRATDSAKSGVGRNLFDGLPARLDRLARTVAWAAPQGAEQYPHEPPRATADNYQRAARVRAVGNAVCVPLVRAFAEAIRETLTAESAPTP